MRINNSFGAIALDFQITKLKLKYLNRLKKSGVIRKMGLGEVLEKWANHGSYNFDDAVEFVGFTMVMENIPEVKYSFLEDKEKPETKHEVLIKNENGTITAFLDNKAVMKIEGNRVSYINAKKYHFDSNDFQLSDFLTGVEKAKDEKGDKLENSEFTISNDEIVNKNLMLDENMNPVGLTANISGYEYNRIAEVLFGQDSAENVEKSKTMVNDFCKKMYENMKAGKVSEEGANKVMKFFDYNGSSLVKAVIENPEEVCKNTDELDFLQHGVLNAVHYDTKMKMNRLDGKQLIEMSQVFFQLKGHVELITKRRGFIIGKYLKGESIKPTLILKWKING